MLSLFVAGAAHPGADFAVVQKMSQFVKEGCDKKFGPTWHCCIGEGFSFDVTSQQKHSLYMMYAGYLGIMLWKC